MKTYFMSWRSDNKRGHVVWVFDKIVLPGEALRTMIERVKSKTKGIKGEITASQFNRVI